jgi:hypothetical protein
MAQIDFDTLPKSRPEARALEAEYYFTGKPCTHGHLDRRRTKDGNCFGCDKVKSQTSLAARHAEGLKPTPRADARRAGLKHYEGWCGQCGATVKKLVSAKFCVHCSNLKTKSFFRTEQGTEARKRADTRRRSDPSQRIGISLRERLRSALRAQGLRKRRNTTWDLVGCGREEARTHLESQFTPGMTWENYGQWHIDHIRPCASFDLTDPEQQKECFHYTNLQPLWAEENIKKGARLVA